MCQYNSKSYILKCLYFLAVFFPQLFLFSHISLCTYVCVFIVFMQQKVITISCLNILWAFTHLVPSPSHTSLRYFSNSVVTQQTSRSLNQLNVLNDISLAVKHKQTRSHANHANAFIHKFNVQMQLNQKEWGINVQLGNHTATSSLLMKHVFMCDHSTA